MANSLVGDKLGSNGDRLGMGVQKPWTDWRKQISVKSYPHNTQQSFIAKTTLIIIELKVKSIYYIYILTDDMSYSFAGTFPSVQLMLYQIVVART